jgi:ubiquinone biosynthesis protein
MKISSIPQIYRNVNRLTEILSVLSKYGLADWISGLQLDFAKDFFKARDGEALARHTREARIRLALSDLGPAFIKLGQLLSTRPDLVGVELATELTKLQQDVAADPPEVVRRIVEDELGQPVEAIFAEFDDVPVASASIGQVHRARLKSGEAVVVKVRHEGIQDTVRKDLDVLTGLAQLVERLPEFAAYRPVATVAEFRRTLRRELDFGREERNLLHFSGRYDGDPHVRIPRPFSEFCTPRVLTMEWIDGVKMSDQERIEALGFDREEIARKGAEFYLESMFRDGFYHADPHPGNIMLLPGNVIALLDFGMVGRIDEQLREQIEDMLLAISHQDSVHLTAIIMRLGSAPPDLDEAGLRSDVTDFVTLYGSQSLDRLQVGRVLTDMSEMIFRYRIMLPSQVAMLLKVLITLEGTGKMLNPTFSLMEVMQPFQRRAMLRRLSPSRRLKKMRRIYSEIEHLAEVMPRRVIDILQQVQEGRFDVHLQHRGFGPSVNRLVLGMLASALFLGSTLLLSRQVPPLIFPESTVLGMHKISVLGLSGCIVSVLLGLRLLRAIGKSGHLDRRD